MTEEEINNAIFTRIMGYLTVTDTKGISIRDLEQSKKSVFSLAKELNISVTDLSLKNNWYLFNGEYYYYKNLYTAMKVVNELLGELLSLYMGLPTIHYTLALDYNNIVGLLSKNFRDKNKKYASALGIKNKHLVCFKDALVSREITDLRKIIDTILIRDFYSSLSDRLRNVLVSVSLFKHVNLEESYDYEFSFEDKRDTLDLKADLDETHEFDTYYNPLFVNSGLYGEKNYIKITYDTLKGMMEYDKYLNAQFEKIMYFDIARALGQIEDNHGIIIADELKDYYSYYDKKRKEELRVGLGK